MLAGTGSARQRDILSLLTKILEPTMNQSQVLPTIVHILFERDVANVEMKEVRQHRSHSIFGKQRSGQPAFWIGLTETSSQVGWSPVAFQACRAVCSSNADGTSERSGSHIPAQAYVEAQFVRQPSQRITGQTACFILTV
jgi:hypothetical protein